jgi:hypothetical protein
VTEPHIGRHAVEPAGQIIAEVSMKHGVSINNGGAWVIGEARFPVTNVQGVLIGYMAQALGP